MEVEATTIMSDAETKETEGKGLDNGLGVTGLDATTAPDAPTKCPTRQLCPKRQQ